MDKFTVKFTSTTFQDRVGYGIYKIYEDLFLPLHERHKNMLMGGIQTEKLCKIRLKAGDKETMGMDAKRLWMPFLATCTVFGWTTRFWTITGFSIKKPFQRFYVWTAAYAGFAGCKQLGCFKAGLQADKHSDRVWDHPQQEAVQHCDQNVHQQQVVHLWPHQTRRGGDLWKEQGEQAQHQGEPSAPVTQGHSFVFFFPSWHHHS